MLYCWRSWRCNYKLGTGPCPSVLSYPQLNFVWNAACTSSCSTWFWLLILNLKLLDISACLLHMCRTLIWVFVTVGFLSIIFLVNSSRKCFVFQIDLLLSFFLWSSDIWIQEWMPASIGCDDFLAIVIELDWADHFVQYMMYSSLDGLNTSEEV